MTDSLPCIVLAAGGTGGHIFPAEALARELLGRGYSVALLTDKRGTKFSDDLPVPVFSVSASALTGGIVGRLCSVAKMGIGYVQARTRLALLKPAAVVGFGGYPSVPTLYAAAAMKLPIILHEQNALPGRANLAMMKKARVIATSFPHVKGMDSSMAASVIYTGNPVRPAFMALRSRPYAPLMDDGPMRILVLGGSLGAHLFSHIVPNALALMPETMRRRIVIAQQCRKEDLDNARSAFAAVGVDAELAPFFHDVPERMAEAHLVIGRSGGSTVAELTVIGRPSILIPYTGGHANEQTLNAEAVAEAGGGWLIPQASFTPEALAIRLESLMALPSSLAKTAAAARSLGKVTAADALADCVASVAHPSAAVF